MAFRIGFLALLIGSLSPAFSASAQSDQQPAPLDYATPENWVCRPESSLCKWNLDAAMLGADGVRSISRFSPSVKPAADCFYLYPTVSQDPGLVAAPGVTEAERRAVRQQVALLGDVCRIFAPFHRQFTATSMRPDFAKPDLSVYRTASRLGEADILAAWDHYLDHDNQGRPFVILGHSQGANRAIDLIKARIEGGPVQHQLLSAILPGAFVTVASGRDTGGTFKIIRPCRDLRQIGCFMAFNAIREETTLPDDVKPSFPGRDLVCTNPANLAGGDGTLQAYLSTTGETILPELTARQGPWTTTGLAIQTPFVSLEGMLTARCRVDTHSSFLTVGISRLPGDHRRAEFVGDWQIDGKPLPVMGLHLIDLNLVAGNLRETIRAQTATYLQEHRNH